MKAERLVVDTNVLISAALSGSGTPARLLERLRRTRAVLLFSEETFAELGSRLLKTKFDPYVSRQARLELLAQIDAISEFVAISGQPMGCRDRDDDKFLETALLGEADCLVSGDSDLLKMHPFSNLPVLDPAALLEALDSVD